MILSILDINDLKKDNKKYIIFMVFCLIFGFVYEIFSHGVYSLFMMCLFVIPLFYLCINLICIRKSFNIPFVSKKIFDLSMFTFTFFSIVKGVLDIYGTTNSLIYIYLVVGILLLIISLISLVLFLPTKK